ncbi:hypothetical protein [Leptospira ainazelensis]|nr:hypothetical protein [Leptospira ainazelensis]
MFPTLDHNEYLKNDTEDHDLIMVRRLCPESILTMIQLYRST